MTDAPPDREAIRKRARVRAEQMGVRTRPVAAADADGTAPEPVPTTNMRALQQLLNRGQLTPGQAESARRMFAAVNKYINDYPEDAA